jgi:hypothetical protein
MLREMAVPPEEKKTFSFAPKTRFDGLLPITSG